MFQSFKLNVNNPHFLVMQGRITKVLNMKPMEMLKMLEEAIGTQMYQEKRARAVKNMEKKDKDLADIEQVHFHDLTSVKHFECFPHTSFWPCNVSQRESP